MADQAHDLDQWQPITAFVATHPQFTETQLRWLIRHASTNDFSVAIRKCGRRWYIHAKLFAEWLENQKQAA